MDTKSKIVRLVEGLLKATKEGLIPWESTARIDAFRAPLGPGLVRIGLQDFDPEACEFVVLDNRGREVDSINEIPERPSLLGNLYHSARHAALNGDELIDHLIRDIEAKTS
jgi:hypothetical protein